MEKLKDGKIERWKNGKMNDEKSDSTKAFGFFTLPSSLFTLRSSFLSLHSSLLTK